MLFNAPEFLLLFLPVVLLGFFLIGRFAGPRWAVLWLVGASLFFYSWWRLDFLPLLVGSILFNFGLGLALARRPSRWLLAIGVAANLGAIGWFKYSGFFAELANDVAGLGLTVPVVILPLAISFYTFQQIAYLVDVYGGETSESDIWRYALFVSFFPQLIAGPIVHHREMLTQFEKPDIYKLRVDNVLLGVAAFSVGLFKKVAIADTIAPQTVVAFGPAAEGLAPVFVDAWYGALAFTLQLYFDFSGYSDMAIGLGLMFGIRLPINFASPFKAASIIEFWQRWHMTLTRFLTSYLYNPIVAAVTRRRMAARKPMWRRSAPAVGPFVVLLAIPTLITMFLAGVWHGAGWQFVAFGLFHGALLVINHAWRALRQVLGLARGFGWAGRAVGVLVTFLAVVISLVFFKAASLTHALTVVQGMFGFGEYLTAMAELGGVDPYTLGTLELIAWRFASPQGFLILAALAVVWTLPNTPDYLEDIRETVRRRFAAAKEAAGEPRRWLASLFGRGGFVEGGIVGTLLAVAMLRALSVAPSEFLYFTF